MYYGAIVAASADTYTAYISLNVNGTWTPLFSQNYTGTPGGETLDFDVVGSSLQLSLNNSLVAYANDSTFATGSVGMLTSGGAVAVSNFNAMPITQQTASSNAYCDHFTTANNGQLDEYWINQDGDFTTAGTGTAAAVSSVSLATVNGITHANEAVSLTISSLATGQQVGLVARYNGSGLANMYYGAIVATSADTYTAYISLNVNGTWAPLFSQNYTGTPGGETLDFDVVGSSLQLSLNGSLVAYANDSTFATGGVGMLTWGGPVAVSNFKATPITQQTASSNAYSDSFTAANNGQLDEYWVNQTALSPAAGRVRPPLRVPSVWPRSTASPMPPTKRSASRSARSRPDSRSGWRLAMTVRAWPTCTLARSWPRPLPPTRRTFTTSSTASEPAQQ